MAGTGVSTPADVTMPSSLEQASRQHYEDGTTGTVFNAEGEPKGGDLETALQQQ